jgi:hypothetical protein
MPLTTALRFRLASLMNSVALTIAITPWAAATVLKCPITGLSADRTLAVREVRMTTRMGRTVRFLVPQFIPSMQCD